MNIVSYQMLHKVSFQNTSIYISFFFLLLHTRTCKSIIL